MAHEWTVLDAHVCTDAALPGASLERPGIQPPLAAADRRPLPFDVLLVDDSSRVARDLADAVRFMQQLTFYGVRVFFISQKRGLAGQLERGHATGAVTYGYRTFAVPDPTGKCNPHGYPILLGKRLEIEPAEARIIASAGDAAPVRRARERPPDLIPAVGLAKTCSPPGTNKANASAGSTS